MAEASPPQLLCSPSRRYMCLELHEVFMQRLSTDLKGRMRISKQFTIPTHTSTLVCTHIPWGGEGHSTPTLKSPLSSTYLPTLTSLSLWMRTGHITAPALLCKSGLSEVFLTLLCRNCFLEIWPNLRSHELYVNTSCSKGKGTLNSFIQREIHLLYLVPLQKRPFFPCCLYNNRSVMRVMTCIV